MGPRKCPDSGLSTRWIMAIFVVVLKKFGSALTQAHLNEVVSDCLLAAGKYEGRGNSPFPRCG